MEGDQTIEPVAVKSLGAIQLTPDGKMYAYTRVVRDQGDLYLAEGLH
jgi:hypothetical protein